MNLNLQYYMHMSLVFFNTFKKKFFELVFFSFDIAIKFF